MESYPYLSGYVALLIDADNITEFKYIEQVLKFSKYFGEVKICRAYGDWSTRSLIFQCGKYDSLEVKRIQVNRVGKNATDHRLLIEAGEILGDNMSGYDVKVFIIVSGDGDFASACEAIKERDREVIGIGNRKKTSNDLRASCTTFYLLEDLKQELSTLEERYPIPPYEAIRISFPVQLAYNDLNEKDEWIWVSFSQLEAKLRERYHNYDRDFGKYTLPQWLVNFKQDYEIRDQMVRRSAPIERGRLLYKAYLQTKRTDSLASLGDIGKALRNLTPDYEELFGSKKLSEWIKEYPDRLRIHKNYVVNREYW